MKAFLEYDQVELDRQYDQRAWAPNIAEVLRRYRENSDRVRSRLGEPRVHTYGASAAETFDLYPCSSARAPLHVFIHGGAWQRLSKLDSAFAAETFVRAGAHFAALDFALLPAVSLAEMASQVRGAVAWAFLNAETIGVDRGRIFVSGHSSGGHLAALIAVTDWAAQGLPADTVKGTLCVSGIYDLKPVRLSARNSYVQLNDETEQALSPQRHLDQLSCELVVACGQFESPEFARQSREFATTAKARHFEGEDLNHFEIIETLADPAGLLGKLALNQMGLSSPTHRA